MDLKSLERDAVQALERVTSIPEAEAVYAKYLGRKDGELTKILRGLGELSPNEKKAVGQAANQLRATLESQFSSKQKSLQDASLASKLASEKIDVTLPGRLFLRGRSHLITATIREISDIFKQLGFEAAEGPEVETDSNNFTDLNILENHPSRDMHDTFYLDSKDSGGRPLLLRTHTSPVQIRVMKALAKRARDAKQPLPPVRMLCPGRVFRHEATDATHAAEFHQIEGLAVDRDISFADLKATLTHFAHKYFGEDLQVRFFPSYFPFVEPGAQMDVQCFSCRGTKRLPSGEACNVCRGAGWIEILGAGLVHPQVLRNVGYDPEEMSGFAFGMGVERIVMTRYQVRDIRHFLESDLRFLEQFPL